MSIVKKAPYKKSFIEMKTQKQEYHKIYFTMLSGYYFTLRLMTAAKFTKTAKFTTINHIMFLTYLAKISF